LTSNVFPADRRTIACPSCRQPITARQLFWTATLLRFKCPHCATRLKPSNNRFPIPWLVVGGLAGFVVGVSGGLIGKMISPGVARTALYVALGLLMVGAIGVIKWRASLALIKKEELVIKS